MKSFIVSLLLPLLINGSAIDLERRQFLGLGSFLPKLKAVKVEELPPQLGVPDAKRVRLIYGPYKIKGIKSTTKLGNGKSMDAGGTSYQNDVDSDFPRDITILKAASHVQNKEGKRVELKDGIYNHHTGFFDITKMNASPYTCANRTLSSFNMAAVPPVIAAGATELAVQVFMASSGEVKSGYYLRKTGAIMNMIDLVNYRDEDQEVYTSTELEYIPGKPAGYRDSYMTLIDPSICGGPMGSAIHAPKGVKKFSINATDIVMTKSGYFVYTLGHMHDGGVNVVFKVNDEVKCDSRALYGGEGHTTTVEGRTWETIRETTPCTTSFKVNKGDRMSMQANYDVELHPSREMGGGHGMSHGGMSGKGMKLVANQRSTSDKLDGEAEQMALLVAYFAPDP